MVVWFFSLLNLRYLWFIQWDSVGSININTEHTFKVYFLEIDLVVIYIYITNLYTQHNCTISVASKPPTFSYSETTSLPPILSFSILCFLFVFLSHFYSSSFFSPSPLPLLSLYSANTLYLKCLKVCLLS